MRRLSLVFLALLLSVPAVGQAKTWRPPYLDLGDEMITVGPTKTIRLLGLDPDKEVITNLSVSPDGGYAALVIRREQALILQVANLRLTGKQSRLSLGEAQRDDENRFVRWAPNSRALMVTESRDWASDEIRVSSFPFKELVTVKPDDPWSSPTFSPDGRLIAYLGTYEEGGIVTSGLCCFDLALKQAVFCEELDGTIVGWTEDNRILLIRDRDTHAIQRAPYEFVAFNLRDRSQTVQPIAWTDPKQLSPDGAWYFRLGVPKVCSSAGMKEVSLSGDRELRPWQWDPQGRFLVAWRSDAIKDEMGRVHKTLTTLWMLRVPEEEAEHPLGHSPNGQLLAVTNADPRQGAREPMAAITSDRKSVVYIAENQLRTKELKTLKGEQAALARQRHEETLKTAAVMNAKVIAAALLMYVHDSGGALPDRDDLLPAPYYGEAHGEPALYDHLQDPRIFSHPEIPEMMCFEYHPPEHLRMDGIVDPAATVLGWLDWGRGWQVCVYADGHCKVVEKKKR